MSKTYKARLDFTAQSTSMLVARGIFGRLRAEAGVAKRQDMIAAVVFSAFAVEAYINSVGYRKIELWDDLEKLPWRRKLTILHSSVKKTPDWSQGPLQFAIDLFSLRDKLAHGKPERVLSKPYSDYAEADRALMTLVPDWLGKVTEQWVTDGEARWRALLIYIGALHGLHDSDHLMHSSGQIVPFEG